MPLPLLACLIVSSAMEATLSSPSPIQAVTALVQRVLPNHHSRFELELLHSGGASAMQLDVRGDAIILRGTGGVELASALNWYLNKYLNVTYDWNTYAENQVPSQLPLPLPEKSAVIRRRLPISYYMNVCTMGYSLAYVPFSYWEKHIDWMAMSGVNMPLGFVGQEWAWVETFKAFNISFEEQQTFYSGPAFLPWYRMGNFRGFNGPLSTHWLEARRALGVQILDRMRSLGMTPALGAFAGHVPKAVLTRFATKNPHANVSRSPDWGNFDAANPDTADYADVYLLEPTDPLYVQVGKVFIQKQEAAFGTDHIYQCDTYNELRPPTSDPGYLKRASESVYAAMTAADPDAVWLMQGWLFFADKDFWKPPQVEAYLGGVARGKMILLDLFGASNPVWSRTASFYGHRFIFCTLLNFGGQQGIVGNVPQVEQGLKAALDANTSIAGVGITMEGIWTNYPVFERQLQLGWEIEISGGEAWFDRYAARRYGGTSSREGLPLPAGVAAAWSVLGKTIYSGSGGLFGSDISTLPSLGGQQCPRPMQGNTPVAPPGYTRRHPSDGYWDPPPKAQTNKSVAECAVACSATAGCQAFEVYVHTAPDRGDCYTFSNLSRPFITLGGGSRTYVQVGAGGGVDGAEHQGLHPPRVGNEGGSPGALATAKTAATASWTKDTDIFKQAWGGLLDGADALGGISSYRFDLVDVGREVLARNFTAGWVAYGAAFAAGDAARCAALSAQLLQAIDDYDALLSTDVHFLLGRWISWARAWGDSESAKDKLEYGARNQVTLWGPTGEINDYAKKEWGGLVGTYYRPRYKLLFDAAAASMTKGAKWDISAYCTAVSKHELTWQLDKTKMPDVPTADALKVSKEMYGRYASR